MPDITPQITVLVSILANIDSSPTDKYTVRYSYVDPASHLPVSSSLACILNAVAPYDVLFSLDYQSTTSGWTFTGATPKPGYAVPSYALSKTALSLTTFATDFASYSFNLTFLNTQTNEHWTDDPQENNLPRPHATSGTIPG